MRYRTVLAVSLLVIPSLAQAQLRLKDPNRTIVLPIAASVTIPAMTYFGDLGATRISLGLSGVTISPGGNFLILSGPSNAAPASALTILGNTPLPAGTYNVRIDFVNVGFATSLTFISATGASLGTCALVAGAGYATLQTCALTFSFPGGANFVTVQPTSGGQMTLKQVGVTLYQ